MLMSSCLVHGHIVSGTTYIWFDAAASQRRSCEARLNMPSCRPPENSTQSGLLQRTSCCQLNCHGTISPGICAASVAAASLRDRYASQSFCKPSNNVQNQQWWAAHSSHLGERNASLKRGICWTFEQFVRQTHRFLMSGIWTDGFNVLVAPDAL